MSLNTILATAPLTATGYHLKATGTALGQSLIWDNGTNVGIGNQGTTYTLDVSGTGRFTSTLLVSGATTSNKFISNATDDGIGQYFWFTGSSAVSENFSIYGYSNNVYLNAYSNLVLRANQLGGSGGYIQLLGGNVGIGTGTPANLLDLVTTTTPLRIVNTISASNQQAWIKLRQATNNLYGADIGIDTTTGGDFVIGRNNNTDTFTETFRIARANGNIGIGCVPSFKLQVQGDDAGSYDQASGQFVISGATNSNKRLNIGYNTTNNIGFIQAGINGTGYSTLLLNPNGGNVVIGTTSDSGRKLQVEGTNTPLLLHKTNNVSGSFCNIWQLGGSETNATSSYYMYCDTDNVGVRAVIYGNGNMANVNNSYGAYSDIKLKENIVDATPKLDDLLKVKIRNFNLKGSDVKQIGVVAQELEEIFPSMIEESNDTIKDENGEYIENGEKTKTVKYSVFVPMLIKAIQELKAEIEELKNK